MVAVLGHQLYVAAGFNDPAFLQHENAVGAADAAKEAAFPATLHSEAADRNDAAQAVATRES